MKALRHAEPLPSESLDSSLAESTSAWPQWLVGTDPAVRLRVQRSLMGTLVYLTWVALELVAVGLGMATWGEAAVLIGFAMSGVIGFYALLRSGYSRRFADPSLTLAQMIFAIVAILFSYALSPPTRSAALQVLCLILVFGMFALTPREIKRVGIGTVALLGGTLIALWWWEGPKFSWQRDGINGLLACVIMPVLSVLTGQFSQMRVALSAHKKTLNLALEQVQTLATRDALTGLYNRGYVHELIEQQSKRSLRSGAPLSIALIDLDHFKRVNDTLGHQVGDEVLCGFARCAGESLRQPEVVARWGGEEFLVLFPDTPVDDAHQALERLRALLALRDLSQSQLGLKITFSAGLAEWDPRQSMERNLLRIDDALYQAKHQGRDRSVLSVLPGSSGKTPSGG